MPGVWGQRGNETTSIVFVHGVLSDGDSCWTNKNGAYWPGLISKDPDLSNLGIYVFTYKTGFFSGTYRLSDIVDSLKEHLQLDDVFNCKEIIFVCHSMGGLVVRKYMVERTVDLLKRNKKIGLFLIASPALGSDYANWLEPLAKFF